MRTCGGTANGPEFVMEAGTLQSLGHTIVEVIAGRGVTELGAPLYCCLAAVYTHSIFEGTL